MASQEVSIGLTFILIALLSSKGMAQSNSNNCTNVIISMSPCLNYMDGTMSTPASACCNQLRNVVNLYPQCLCQVLNGGGRNLGLDINQNQASTLPRTCNVQTPSTSQCNTGGGSRTGTGNGNGNGATTVNGSSEATSNELKLTVSHLFFIVLASSYVLSSNMA